MKQEELAASDPEMAELAQEEITRLTEQLKGSFQKWNVIIEANKEEEARPYGVVLEVRAGAGGTKRRCLQVKLAEYVFEVR